MSNRLGAAAARQTVLGTRVAGAAKTLAATGTGTIFTVAGGMVAITSIVGVVTTAIQAQANAVKLVATPTVGTVNDLSGTVETNGAIVGSLIGATGLTGDVLLKSTGGGVSNSVTRSSWHPARSASIRRLRTPARSGGR